MAEYASASPSGVKLHTWRSFVYEKALLFPNSHFPVPPKRKFLQERYKVLKFSPGRTCTTGLPYLKESPYHIRETSSRCSCLGSLVDSDGITASELVAVSDQLLLMASIVLTYMAGVIPIKRSTFSSLGNIVDNNAVRESSTTSSGSAQKNDARVNSKCAWAAVEEKLLDSLDTIENRNNLGNRLLEIEQQQGKRPLSLYAISEGPKLRLLWASFKLLENEVNDVLDNCRALSLGDWLITVPDIIRKSCNRACIAWLLEELHLENKKADEGIITLMIQKLKGDETVLQNIRKSGKEELYAELLYFLKFGSLRKGCYEQSLFSSNGDSILEDMVITIADGVAGVYLELISVDGNLSNELNDLGMIICYLSTRALQRLRNEVSLNQWLYQNMEAVASMYEDRFDLCTLQSKIKEEPRQIQTEENFNWWKKLTQRKSGMLSPSLSYVVISHFSMPVKRTKELRALTGWRYYFSLYLELSDITTPLIRAVIDKISSAISFFLVSLIGRSLGLIYTGIRQSLRWK